MPQWKILVVEDDPALQQLYRLDFEDAGLDVTLASNGLEAAKFLRNWKPDLVVTDIKMPEAGGESVMDVIEMNYPTTPVIVVSAFKHYKETFKSDHRVILDFYLKPVNFREIAEYIKAYLDGKAESRLGPASPGPKEKAKARPPEPEVPVSLPVPEPLSRDIKAHSLETITPETDTPADPGSTDLHRGSTK